MEQRVLQVLVVDTGRILLEEGLAARTWGNVSCRLDEDRYLITPSGMDYKKLTPQPDATSSRIILKLLMHTQL